MVCKLLKMWCGRRESNPHEPFKLCGFSVPSTAFAARMQCLAEASASGLRSGLSLHPLPDDPGLRCRPSSLYTFPACVSPGLARDCHERGFPDFERFCIVGFPASTHVFLKSAASAIPPRPRAALTTVSMIGQVASIYTLVWRSAVGGPNEIPQHPTGPHNE